MDYKNSRTPNFSLQTLACKRLCKRKTLDHDGRLNNTTDKRSRPRINLLAVYFRNPDRCLIYNVDQNRLRRNELMNLCKKFIDQSTIKF